MKRQLFPLACAFLLGALSTSLVYAAHSALLAPAPAFNVVTVAFQAAVGLLLAVMLLLRLTVLPVLYRSARAVRRRNRALSVTDFMFHRSPLQPRPPVGLVAFLAFLGVTGVAGAQTLTDRALDFGVFAPMTGVLFNLLGVGLLALTGLGSQYLLAKTALIKNERFRSVMVTVETVVFAKVREINAEAVNSLKAASADGKLTQAEAAAALATAVKESWAALPAIVQAFLSAQAGSPAQAQGKFLVPVIKNTVEGVKSYGTLQAGAYSLGSAPKAALGVIVPSLAEVADARNRIN